MNYSHNFIMQVTVLDPKYASWPIVVAGRFYVCFRSSDTMLWHDTWGNTYKESTVKTVFERLCRVFFSIIMEASKAC